MDKKGCYTRFPSGCPKQNHRSKYDRLQKYPEECFKESLNGASKSKEKCYNRKKQIDLWCGVNDVETVYIQKDRVQGIYFSNTKFTMLWFCNFQSKRTL